MKDGRKEGFRKHLRKASKGLPLLTTDLRVNNRVGNNESQGGRPIQLTRHLTISNTIE